MALITAGMRRLNFAGQAVSLRRRGRAGNHPAMAFEDDLNNYIYFAASHSLNQRSR